ncbi:MAG TPA: ElyC/SanA/YdcF family protein [Candidatus Competibacteraceae bacterium]|nr:ElyC/SanA/YdcF family protein [Candidatus Competibacteraceae bacterium]
MPTRWRRLGVLAVLPLAALLLVLSCDAWIESACAGACYDDLEALPVRSVGLLLGTSKYLPGGRRNLYYQYRIDAAERLYKAGKVQYLLVSGDNRHISYDEATTLRKDLIARGIPPERIYRDYAGFRTLDSVIRASEVFGQRDFIVISQRFHNARALYIAHRNGLDEVIAFDARDVDLYYGFKTRLRELLARVAAVLDVELLGAAPKFLGPRIEIGVAPPT